MRFMMNKTQGGISIKNMWNAFVNNEQILSIQQNYSITFNHFRF